MVILLFVGFTTRGLSSISLGSSESKSPLGFASFLCDCFVRFYFCFCSIDSRVFEASSLVLWPSEDRLLEGIDILPLRRLPQSDSNRTSFFSGEKNSKGARCCLVFGENMGVDGFFGRKNLKKMDVRRFLFCSSTFKRMLFGRF